LRNFSKRVSFFFSFWIGKVSHVLLLLINLHIVFVVLVQNSRMHFAQFTSYNIVMHFDLKGNQYGLLLPLSTILQISYNCVFRFFSCASYKQLILILGSHNL
jgi:hypothetical protein